MEMMLEQFKTIFDRPEKVKKLREMILDLAVRGKLVEQDPNDEPASVLLERIREEKERLVREKKIKKEKALANIRDEEKPFELPDGWEWARLGELGDIFNGNSINAKVKESTYSKVKSGYDYISTKDVSFDGKELAYNTGIKIPYDESKFKVAHSGAVLICSEGGSAGRKIAITDRNICFGNKLYAIEPIKILSKYVYYIYQSGMFFKAFANNMTGIIGGISIANFKKIFIPVCSINEQKRIVEKLDSLMYFCDKLEEALEKKVHYGELCAKSIFNSIGNVSTSEELEETLRFILANFKDISLGDNAVKELKNCILQLAVQGKLVEQDPNDEPASVLLERIREEKERLVKEKKIKKEKELPEISDEEKAFELPEGWEWVRFSDVTICRDGERIPVSKTEREKREKVYDYYGASGVIDKIDSYIFDKPLLLIGEDGANLINRSTPIAFIARGRYWVNNHAHVLDSYCEDVLYYLSIYINSIDLKPYVTGTAQPKMNQAKMNSIISALPPLAEQKRIVKKVDALMSLCDELENKIQEQKRYSNMLMESILKNSFSN